jgi:hypothetical protein
MITILSMSSMQTDKIILEHKHTNDHLHTPRSYTLHHPSRDQHTTCLSSPTNSASQCEGGDDAKCNPSPPKDVS